MADYYANVYAPLETLDADTVESWYKEGNVLFTCYVDEDDLAQSLMDIPRRWLVSTLP